MQGKIYPKVSIAQLGARRHYQQPVLLSQWGVLDTFFTDLYTNNNLIFKLLRYPDLKRSLPNAAQRMVERYEPALDNENIVDFPVFGYQYAKALQKATPKETTKIFIETGKEFCRNIIQYGLGNADAIYGFNSASLELFQYAKAKGLRCILDQTIAERSYLNQLMSEEYKKWSDWLIEPFEINPIEQELIRREQQEQDLADQIICGSDFVKDSLVRRGVDPKKIYVAPLGRKNVNTGHSKNKYVADLISIDKRNLHILFAGSVGLRKGIPYLLEALRQLKENIPFVCKIAGSFEIRAELRQEYTDVCQFLGRVPRANMASLYRWADLLVFPSICEGSAMVTYEALKHGLPVITTYNSGSLVQEINNDWIIPIRDSEAITKSILKFFEDSKNNEINHSFKEDLDLIQERSIGRQRLAILGSSCNL